MKSRLIFGLLLLVGLCTLTSCGNKIDKMIDQYEYAIESGDWQKQTAIASQLSKEHLSSEQEARITELALKALSPEYMKKVQENVQEQMKGYQDMYSK